MNRNTLKGRLGVLFLALMILVNGVPSGLVAAASSWIDITDNVPAGAKVIATQIGHSWTSIWHFSGGYWARTNTDPLRIYDHQLRGNISNLENLVNHTIQFEFALPQAVRTALADGKKVGVVVSAPPGYDYWNTSKGKPQTRIVNNTLHFQAYPRFHLVPTGRYSYQSFVSGLNAFIPFVDPKYGHNGYSIFSTNSNVHRGAAAGYFDPSNPTRLGPSGTIHPSQIRNSNGNLISGFQVQAGGQMYNSSNVKIGVGTFVNAGAVGLIYEYNLDITYYEIDDTDVAVTAITPTLFPASQSVSAFVTVQNLGRGHYTGVVQHPRHHQHASNCDAQTGRNQNPYIQFYFPRIRHLQHDSGDQPGQDVCRIELQ
jgi:hypothetical protein